MQTLLARIQSDEGTGNMDDEEFAHATQVKYAISVLLDYAHLLREQQALMIMDAFGITRATALKRLSEAMEIFPSMEKASKAFERARLTNFIYKFIALCISKQNTRDTPQYMKLLIEMWGLNDTEDIDSAASYVTIINMLKSSPESLGIPLPDGFDLNQFVENLEGQYARKQAGKPE